MAAIHPLRRYRDERKITQEALGRQLGVTGVTVWRWENGRRTPRTRDLPRIVEVTGLSPAELLGLETKEPAQ